jgi:hypothetical protein
MKPAVLCLLLVSACSNFTSVPKFRAYALTWSCLSPDGCERTEQVTLFDRAEIFDDGRSEFIEFKSTRDGAFWDNAQMVPSDALPEDCVWLHGFSFLGIEADPSMLCRVSGGFELELSVSNRDPETRSEWLVEGREVDP